MAVCAIHDIDGMPIIKNRKGKDDWVISGLNGSVEINGDDLKNPSLPDYTPPPPPNKKK